MTDEGERLAAAQERIREAEEREFRALRAWDEGKHRIRELEALCAEMRYILQEIHSRPMPREDYLSDISKALSSDAGKGWVSPEQAEALRTVLQEYRNDHYKHLLTDRLCQCSRCKTADKLLEGE